MQFLSKLFKKEQKQEEKQSVNEIYNKQLWSLKSPKIPVNYNTLQRIEQFELVLEQQIIDLAQLKSLTWRGAPQVYRARVWKLLLKYIPPNHMSQMSILHKKRQDYLQYIKNYYESISDRDENEQKIIKIIQNDVLRTQPEYQLFREEKIQSLFRRLLFIWSQRHPMSGYVQGINDVASPLVIVFLNEYIQIDFSTFSTPKEFHKIPDDILLDVEADIYWCLSKIIENIQDYYIHNQPGVVVAYQKIKELLSQINPQLLEYFNQQQIDFNHFAFRWVMCLLIREFPLYLAIRLLDTYLAEGDDMVNLHIYTVTNLILKCEPELINKAMGEAVLFLQNLPTKVWTETDLEMLLQEAYVFQQQLSGSTNQSMRSSKILQ